MTFIFMFPFCLTINVMATFLGQASGSSKKSDVVNCYFIERGPFVTRLHFLYEISIFFHWEFWMPKDRLSSLGERGNCSYLVSLTLAYQIVLSCNLSM